MNSLLFCLFLLLSAALPALTLAQPPTSNSLFPRFHPRPHQHWLNDPSGPVYYNGMYHLFNQYNPKGSAWGSMSWSHLISFDLVFWMELPVAMIPDQWYDSDGVFTGSITVMPDGKVIALYTCAGHGNTQRQCVAYPRDLSDKYLQSWVKLDKNPVIADPPAGGDLSQFRDPTTAWKVGDRWYMAVAAKAESGATVWLYSTTDPSFATWTSEGPLYQDNGLGFMFECPDMFPLTNHTNPNPDTVYALKLSEFALPDFPSDYYRLGKYDTQRQKFVPIDNTYQLLDHGRIYASKRFYDPKTDRHIWYGWVTEDYNLSPTLDWAGSNTLPRSFGFNADLMMLTQQPLPELSALRVQSTAFTANILIAPGDYFDASNASWTSAQFEVSATFDFSPCYPTPCVAGLTLLSSTDAAQATNVYIAINEPVGPFDMQQIVVPNPTVYKNVSMPLGLSRAELVEGCRQLCLRDHMCVSWTYFGNFVAPTFRSHREPQKNASQADSKLGATSNESAELSESQELAEASESSESAESTESTESTETTESAELSSQDVVFERAEPRSPGLELMGTAYSPPNPVCQLSSGSDLDPTFNIHSFPCSDCASGLDYSDTPLPLLVADRSISGDGGKTSHFAVVPVGNNQRLTATTLRAFVDHSIIEVFVDDVIAVTVRVYPDQSSTRWGVFGGFDNVADISASVQAWQLLNAVA